MPRIQYLPVVLTAGNYQSEVEFDGTSTNIAVVKKAVRVGAETCLD